MEEKMKKRWLRSTGRVMRRFLAFVLVFVLTLTSVNVSTWAAEDATGDAGEIALASVSATAASSSTSYTLPSYELRELADGTISYTNANTVTQQFVCEELGGIYLLSGKYLSFYSLETGEASEVYTFTGDTAAYAQGDTLYVLYSNTVYVYDLINQALTDSMSIASGYTGQAVGADASGRIYVATSRSTDDGTVYEILLYSADGDLLSSCETGARIYTFDGFDSSNGTYYVDGYYNWVYWGYDHPGRAAMYGSVSNNVITFSSTAIVYQCQSSYYLHQNGAALLNDKYLVASSTTYGGLYVMDSDNDLDDILSLGRSAIDYTSGSYYYDTTSIGVRVAYQSEHDSLIIYTGDKTLVEYDMNTGEKLANFTTAHYVFNILQMGDTLLVIEKEDDVYYLEIVDWSESDGITLSGTTSSLKVGEATQLTADAGRAYSVDCEWTSSNSSVASVTSTGRVIAWNAGTATITASILDGKYSATYKVTVTASDLENPDESAVRADGTVTNNASDNNYSVYYASNVNSYLVENEDGTFTRVEYISGTGVLVEVYSSDYELQSSKTLTAELSIFGAFYSGEDYNFLVFGQANTEESDDCEVIRVVKYDKNWNRISQCSICGANTYIPFDAGSARLTEADGSLYLYTCHEMYQSSDGYHHQANMTFVITEESMEVSQSYYDVMNISYGYVSHSFNQFIQTDGTYIYRVDHGDANPRAISITRCDVGGDITDVYYTYAFSINGSYGANATGVSIGGMELSADNVLIAGNSVDQSDEDTYSAYGQRNIFLSVTDKNLEDTNTIWLTSYTSDDGITPRTPQLVKLNDYQFLVMWEEYNSSTEEVWVRAVTVDEDGTAASEIVTWNARLSDCQPIVSSDGLVRWYATNGSRLVMYVINPYDLDGAQNINGFVTNLSACTITLSKTSYTYDGSAKKPTVTVKDGSDTLTKGTDYTVSYSSNTNAGTATVTVTGIGEYAGTVEKTFKISKASQSISVDASVSIGKGKTVSLGASGQGTLTYSSSDTSVVTVNSSGKVTGVKKGSAVITIKASGNSNYKAATATVTVTVKNVQTITVSSTKTLTYGDSSKSLGASCLGGVTLKYKSSDTSIVKVSSSGKVTAVGVGTATITITAAATDTYASATATVKVTVNQKNISKCQMVFSKVGNITTSTLDSCLILADGNTALEEYEDYIIWGMSYSYGSNGVVSYVTVYAEGWGNYTGEATFDLDPITAKTVIKSATKTSSGIKITWQKETGAVGYQIYRKTGSGSYSLVKTITKNSTTSWTDTTVADYKQYTYYVRAYTVNSSGKVYATKSSTKTANTYLTTPTIKSASNTSTGVKLTWSKVSGAAKYQIWRKTSSGSWTKLGTTTSTSYTDKTAKSGTTYYYRMRCVKSNGTTATSLYSSSKKTVRMTGVTISSVKNSSSKKMTVKWSKNTKATGYQIQYSTSSSFASGNKTVTVSGASSSSKVIGSLTKNKTYYVRIRTYKTVSKTKYYSAWSSKKSVKISK